MTTLKFDKKEYLNVGGQPLAGTSLVNWIKLLFENRFKIDWRYIPKALYVTLMVTVISPFRFYERLRFDERVNEVKVVPPIFIVGHFRSGTTFLHYLMGQDKNLAYVSTFETMCPWVFLGSKKIFKGVVRGHLPEKRPMDDLEMEADLPYEEEYAIGNLSPYSFYHGWYFPRKLDYYFRRYVLFDDADDDIKEGWRNTYTYLLKKMSYKYPGKPILLKSPVNTGRIKLLLETFPDSRFIHICRDPYKVYLSTWRLYEAILPTFSFQHVEYESVDRFILDFYREVYKRYFDERDLIPDGNLVEIRYEEFVKKPVDTLKAIYKTLNIKGFEQAKPAFKSYVKAHESYKPYTYKIDESIREKVYDEWGFAFEEFGYNR